LKLSVIILCWNDLKVLPDCLKSIYAGTREIEFQTIVSDNGSTDGSPEFVRDNYPQVRLIENGRNLRFAKGNNVAIRESRGEYVLILNPDTIIHDGALDQMVAYADRHPEGGAFGCRVVNEDGSYQEHVRPLPSIRTEWMRTLRLGPLSRFSDWFNPGVYVGWKGDGEREVGWLAGCFLMIRGDLLKKLGGFDEQFFYYFEDTDLCRRVWESGYSVLYAPDIRITHLKGVSTKKRYPVGFTLDRYVTQYRYFYKIGGRRGVRQCRTVCLAWLLTRRLGLGLMQLAAPNEDRKMRLEMYGVATQWNWRVDPVRLAENNEEPSLDVQATGRVLER
jgi:GT2 family glycosyltransferase